MKLPKPPSVNHQSFGLLATKLKAAIVRNPKLKAIAFQTQSTPTRSTKGNNDE